MRISNKHTYTHTHTHTHTHRHIYSKNKSRSLFIYIGFYWFYFFILCSHCVTRTWGCWGGTTIPNMPCERWRRRSDCAPGASLLMSYLGAQDKAWTAGRLSWRSCYWSVMIMCLCISSLWRGAHICLSKCRRASWACQGMRSWPACTSQRGGFWEKEVSSNMRCRTSLEM